MSTLGKTRPFLGSSRMLVTIMCFLAVSTMMCFRLNMSVAIVCMVNHTSLGQHSNTSNTFYTDSEREDGVLIWNKNEQGQVLGAYYYGFMASQIPAGWAVRKLGGKNLILASSLTASLTCLLIPVTSIHSVVGIILLRVFFGLLGGLINPAVQTLISKWAPPSERSTIGSITFAGFPFGTLMAFTVAGFMCQHGFNGGWPSVFYTFSIIGCVFCVAWLLLVSENPESHMRITRIEKEFIFSSLQGSISTKKQSLVVPWRKMLTSLPVYAIIVTGIATDYVLTMFLLYLPTYLAEVMQFNISANGVISSLPFIFCFLALNVGGYVSDVLMNKTKLTTGTVRKLCSAFGKIMCIASLIIIGFIDFEQPNVVVALLVVSIAGVGFMTIGYFINPLDIAAEYSGLIIAIASTAGSIASYISSAIVGAVMSQGSTRESWQIVFWVSACVVGAALLFHAIFASGNLQPWAKLPLDYEEPENPVEEIETECQPSLNFLTNELAPRLPQTQDIPFNSGLLHCENAY